MQLSVEPDDGAGPIVDLAGECDVASADALRVAVRELLSSVSPGGRVTIDLHALTFLDCSGLGALVELSNEAASHDVELRLRAVSAQVSRILTLTAMLDFFATEP